MPGRPRLGLLVIDAVESLRPPGFDVMLFLVALLGGVLAVIQPITDPATLVVSVLDPTLLAVAIFLALRAGAGITGLVESGVMQVYLAYPVSRPSAALVLWASRVLLPASVLVAAPVLAASAILYPVASSDPARLAAAVYGYMAQALLYGTAFALIAVKARNPGTASLLSIAFYFTYTVMGIILLALSTTLAEPILANIGKAILYYRTVLDMLTAPENVEAWQAAWAPLAAAALLAAYLAYFTRRFEA